MLSTIASFFWGSKTTDPSSDAEVCPNNIKDDVIVDVITNDVLVNDVLANDVIVNDCLMNDVLAKNGPPNDAPPSGTVLSISSLSDEEAGWVLVNSKQEPTESTVSEKENEQVENEPPVTKSERKSTSNVPVPAAKPQNIPSSALHTSSVLNALAELRPQQKSERRHKESRLKHKQMERSNKALQVCSSSNRPNRRRFMYSPERSSRAVNNRKC